MRIEIDINVTFHVSETEKTSDRVGPFSVSVESESLLGRPIYQIAHNDGDVICHGGSGDYPGFSNSGRLVCLRDPKLDWHIVDVTTWEIVGFIPHVDERKFVTKHVMWAAEDDSWLNGSIDYLPEVEGQWRSGTGGGRRFQFVQLYRADGTAYYFLDTVKEEILGSVHFPEAVGGLGPRFHNPVMARIGFQPVICGGIVGEWQHVTHAIDASGELTELEQIEHTDANKWSHEFYDDAGGVMVANVQRDSRLESIRLDSGDTSVVADQDTWQEAYGEGFYQNMHGDLTLDGGLAVGSIKQVGSDEVAIVCYALSDSWVTQQVAPPKAKYGQNSKRDFWSATRPTIAGEGGRIAWHGRDNDKVSVFLTEV